MTAKPKLTGNRCECAACGRFFGGLAIFDAHRSWHPDDAEGETNRRRVCCDDEKLTKKGYQLRDGIWRNPPMTDEQKAAMKDRLS